MPRFTDRISVGAHLRVSPFCVGMVPDPRLIPAAFDAGINFFFLSTDLHWPLYEGSRRGLCDLLARGGGIRDQIVIAAVSYISQPKLCIAPFLELLDERPEFGRLDIAVAGAAYSTDCLARLSAIRRLGPADAALGASFHDREAALTAVNHGLVDIAYIRYNPIHSGARHDLFPYLRADRDARVFNFKSMVGMVEPERVTELGLSDDYWLPHPTDYYRYALTAPIDGILFSPDEPRHLDELAAALEKGPLDEPEEQHLENLGLLDLAG